MIPNIEEIFLPREHFNATSVYISRKKYEKEISSCLKIKTNIFISGESGSGKTWLYEIFFNNQSIKYITINLSEISFHESLFHLLERDILDSITNDRKDIILEKCYKKIQSTNKNKPSFIVFDNLEHVHNDLIKQELISLIHILDNRNFDKYNVRCMLVGIPNSLKEFFSGLNSLFDPIANRIREIPKLNGFEKEELKYFIEKTFVEKLFFSLSKKDIEEIMAFTINVTDLIPLRVQQFLLELSSEIINNNKKYMKSLCYSASKTWINSHYSELDTIFDEYFLSPNGKVQKRNQILFLLGKITKDGEFTNKYLTTMYNKTFPITSSKGTTGISAILAVLTKGSNPIVKKICRDKYRLKDSRIRILINSKLSMNEKEVINNNDI